MSGRGSEGEERLLPAAAWGEVQTDDRKPGTDAEGEGLRRPWSNEHSRPTETRVSDECETKEGFSGVDGIVGEVDEVAKCMTVIESDGVDGVMEQMKTDAAVRDGDRAAAGDGCSPLRAGGTREGAGGLEQGRERTSPDWRRCAEGRSASCSIQSGWRHGGRLPTGDGAHGEVTTAAAKSAKVAKVLISVTHYRNAHNCVIRTSSSDIPPNTFVGS